MIWNCNLGCLVFLNKKIVLLLVGKPYINRITFEEVSKNICEMQNCEQTTHFCRKLEMPQQEQP